MLEENLAASEELVGSGETEITVSQERPLSGLFRHARLVVFLSVASAVALIVSDLNTMTFIQRVQDSTYRSQSALNAAAATVDGWTAMTNTIFFIIFVWSAIVIGRWTYRAMANVRSSGLTTSVSPGWAVGWYFIPVAFLWMPFRGLAQIWRGSHGHEPTGDALLPGAMRVWWAAFLLTNFAARLASTLSETEDLGRLQTSISVNILSHLAHILAALTILKIMRQITSAQQVVAGT